jgi:hypothetical protein
MLDPMANTSSKPVRTFSLLNVIIHFIFQSYSKRHRIFLWKLWLAGLYRIDTSEDKFELVPLLRAVNSGSSHNLQKMDGTRVSVI